MAKKRYQTVGLGGSFDRFHSGHESFLLFAAELGEYLVIGVTDPILTKHKPFPELIQPYQKRVQSVHRFCANAEIPHQIVRLYDPYGPTVDSESRIEVLAVTQETAAGADKINKIRLDLKMPVLPVFVHKLVLDQEKVTLSAARIRAGAVNRRGSVYSLLFEGDLKLNEEQRQFFGKIQGQLVGGPRKTSGQIIVVGDVSLAKFQANNWHYDLGVFDGHSERKPTETKNLKTVNQVNNPAGIISRDLFSWMSKYFQQTPGNTLKKPQLLEVIGEEDLATVAAVMAAPLKTLVYYGQPGEGMVEISVSEQIKEQFRQVLDSERSSK
jgi:pantetheine-phosphate adenylyltransferase